MTNSDQNNKVNKQNSCMDDFDPDSLKVSNALKYIYAAISPISEAEVMPIRESLNRVLSTDIISSINVPTATNSAMDGYALHGDIIPKQGTSKIKVIGTAFAGKPYQDKVGQGECVRIMTGAVMPEATDTVIIQEHVERTDDEILIDSETKSGSNVRQAGEDITIGDVILEKGMRIRPADIGLIASLGIGEVEVIRKLRIAFFSTGDELCSIGEELINGSIYDSNRYTLFGMLSELNVTIMDMGIIRDNREDLQQAFESAAAQADVIITTGGVSVGEADFVKEILQETGTVNFWKVAMKPGRPLAFGQIKDAHFFGLPGNPVSVMVTFYQFVKPAIRHLMSETETETLTMRVPCISNLKKRPGRVEYQRGILERDEDEQWVVRKTGAQGSGILRSMSQANCFIVLPMESASVEPGTMVEVQPFS
ncbi:MAG: molybdopterin molybdotransferase MoeA [Gammaproteobacteria bacterium]|nr:molybdopterin molybdotransferase MoeA [Gammaproteobacteria bacterium]